MKFTFFLATALTLVFFASESQSSWKNFFESQSINSESSWYEIGLSPSYQADIPRIAFMGSRFLIPANEVCHFDDATMFYGGTKEVCTKYQQLGDNTDCVQYKEVELTRSRTFEKTICAKYQQLGDNTDCVQYKTYLKTDPIQYIVNVRKVSGGSTGPVVFKKPLTIRACD